MQRLQKKQVFWPFYHHVFSQPTLTHHINCFASCDYYCTIIVLFPMENFIFCDELFLSENICLVSKKIKYRESAKFSHISYICMMIRERRLVGKITRKKEISHHIIVIGRRGKHLLTSIDNYLKKKNRIGPHH